MLEKLISSYAKKPEPVVEEKSNPLGAFLLGGLLAVFLLLAGYIAHAMIEEKKYREKWYDYDDCGWS